MACKTLIFIDSASDEVLRELERISEDMRDFTVICLSNDAHIKLASTRLSGHSKTYADYLQHDDWLQIDQDAMQWLKSIPACPLRNGTTLKEVFANSGVSFWWFIEEFFTLNGGLFDHVKMCRACEAAIAQEAPERIIGLITDEAHYVIINHYGHKANCDLEWPPESSIVGNGTSQADIKAFLKNAIKLSIAILGPISPLRMLHSVLVVLRRFSQGFTRKPGSVLILSSVPYSWRVIHNPETGEDRFADSYWDAVEKEIATNNPDQGVLHLAVRSNRAQDKTVSGRLRYNARLLRNIPDYVPLSHYGTPASCLRVARGCIQVFREWTRVVSDPSLSSALCYEGVDFSRVMVPKISRVVFGFLPSFARVFEEARNALEKEKPSVALLNGETTAQGRTLVAACRMQKVPTVGMQHGCISVLPSMHAAYYHLPEASVLHDSTEQGLECPIPTRTVVWGPYFMELLTSVMHYPPEAVTVTGNPRYDVLKRSSEYDATGIRKRLRLKSDRFTMLLATAGASMKSDFQPPHNNRVHLSAVLDCFEQMEGAQLIIKLHPLDDASLYEKELNRAREHPDVTIVDEFDILALISAADVLICRYSGTIIEAAMFDKPAVNLNLLDTPDNIEFVAEGGAYGVTNVDDLYGAIESLQEPGSRIRRDLEVRRQLFVERWALKVDGLSARRVAHEAMKLATKVSVG